MTNRSSPESADINDAMNEVYGLFIKHAPCLNDEVSTDGLVADLAHAMVRRHAQGTRGCADIAAERQRQINEEGWTAERDDHYSHGKLASAGLCYVYAGIFGPHDRDAGFVQRYWPWHSQWWKPSDTRRNLVKAGALVAAEIDRLDRASALPSTDGAPGHTDLMVSPESIDEFVEANPLPADTRPDGG